MNIHVICSIDALQSGLNFFEENLPIEIIQTATNFIISQSITAEKKPLTSFTYCKLKTSPSTWKDWEASERKQLNQLHGLQMFGQPNFYPNEKNAVIL